MGQALPSALSPAPTPIFEPIVLDGRGYTQLRNFCPLQERMKLLRHPNLAMYVREKKTNVITVLPICCPLTCTLPMLSLSEVLYGLRGIAHAIVTCAQAQCYFKTVEVHHIGVAMAADGGSGCHAVHANRWIIVDFSGASGVGFQDSLDAFIELACRCIAVVDPDLSGFAAYPESAVNDILQWLDIYTASGYHDSHSPESAFAELDCIIRRLDDPLIKAFDIAIELPACFAHDCDSEDSTFGQLTSAYDSLKHIVRTLSSQKGVQVLERCVLPWLLDPVHLYSAVSAPLFDLIFNLPSITKQNSIMQAFIQKCIYSSDPNIYMRFCAHMNSLVQFIGDEDITLVYFGVQYTIFHTASILRGEFVSTPSQLHYCHSVLKALVPLVREMIHRGMSDRYFTSLVTPLISLFDECEHAMEQQVCEFVGDVNRLLRDTVVSLCAISPHLPEYTKLDVCSVMFKGTPHIQEQVIYVVVACIGTTIPLEKCVFLWATFLTLARSREQSVRVAICSGLLRLREAIPCGVPPPEALSPMAADRGDRSSEHNTGNAHMNAQMPPIAADITLCVPTFVSSIARYFGKSDSDSVLIASLGKERIKSSKELTRANAVFRTGSDKLVYTALLPVSVF